MRIFRSFESAQSIKNPVVTTGSFDGVHIGHKTIITRLNMLAARYKGESALITFYPHPRKVLYPETVGKSLRLINTQEEKIFLLERTGLQNLIIVEFTKEFSQTTSEQFVRDYLHGILKAKVIVAGFNHHFGFNKEGDYKHLWNWRKKYNFEAEEIPEQDVYNETVSSTRIRKAVSEGNIQRANAYLDSYYLITGSCISAKPEFSDCSSKWLKIIIPDNDKLLPPAGIYAASAGYGRSFHKAMVVVTVNSYSIDIFVEVLKPEAHITGDCLTIYFLKKMHGAINPSEKDCRARIANARAEIFDLIY